MNSEIWKAIVKFEGLYEVSDLGRVRSLPRPQIMPYGGITIRGGIILKPIKQGVYLRVTLCRMGTETQRLIHRIVLETFRGLAPSNKHESAHEDGNPSNNKLTNLFWKTSKENSADQRRHGTLNIGERNGAAKLTENEVQKIRLKYEQGLLQREIAIEFNVSRRLISRIVNREVWRHV